MQRSRTFTLAALVAAALLVAAPLAASATPFFSLPSSANAVGPTLFGWLIELAGTPDAATVTKDGTTSPTGPVAPCDDCTAGGPDSDPDGRDGG